MRKVLLASNLLLGGVLLASAPLKAAESVGDVQVDIPYRKFVLTNGLTLIVHEDHKAPIVAVNLWYHVGSKNEKPGKTGFAHLFEHLMFTGSEHFKGTGDQRGFFETMERIGATDLNGTTSNDRTDFFEDVPVNALDIALWLESDRMGHLLGSIDQARLDTQRGVVQNEKRQDENQPYGVTDELITKGTAPPGHPYSWTVIGSMADLNAASLADVKDWFTNYYGAANVVLVLAGDIDPDTALQKAEHFFGDIPRGRRWPATKPGFHGSRAHAGKRSPTASPWPVFIKSGTSLPMATRITCTWTWLATCWFRASHRRLYKRLVYDDQIATDVSAGVDPNEISSHFQIIATARPGGNLARIEKAIDEELARFIADGPTAEELQRVKAGKIAAFVRGIERIGGFGGKSDVLAMNETFRGSPDFFKTVLKDTREAAASDLLRAAKKWLTHDVYILEVHPFPQYKTTASTVDRSQLPAPGPEPQVKFPALQRATLANGLKIVLAERHSLPLVNFSLQVDAGYAADQFAIPGTAKLALQMMDEGTATRTALQISDQLYLLGANLDTGSSLDVSRVNLSTLTATLNSALDIYADAILNPAFPQADFKRLQSQLLATIQQEKSQPFGIALRVFPGLLYGSGHAYGNPLTGSGTEASIARLTRDDLRQFHRTWFKPNHATLVIVGDTTLEAIRPKLEQLLGAWQPGDVPAKNISRVELRKQSAVYLIDRPGSLQSVILAGEVGFPKADPDDIAIETMNVVLGGNFTSRINMNLREEKHWAYGAGTVLVAARGQGPFLAYAPVQTDKTKESMMELNKELHDILGRRPITGDELTTAQKEETLALPGKWETSGAIASSIDGLLNFGLPADYYTTYPAKVRALSPQDLETAARKVVHPDQLVWVVVGDRSKIEPGLRELGWGEIHLLDTDGQPVK